MLPQVPRGVWQLTDYHPRFQLLDDGHTVVTAKPGDKPELRSEYDGLEYCRASAH
jgi:hypothetical protein